MANTTNYNWETPDDTDLVKDGAAAIRSLGSAIDSTVFTNSGNAINRTIVDAKGDLIAATAADTVARLAVGANGTVLTADSAETTGLKWVAAAAAWSPNLTLLNTGGTSLTGATTITVNVSAFDYYLIIIDSGSSANAGSEFDLRFNGYSGSNYGWYHLVRNTSGFVAPSVGGLSQTSIRLGQLDSTDAGNNFQGMVTVLGGKNTGVKSVQSTFVASGANAGGAQNRWGNSIYTGSSAISSISVISSSGNWDAGTLYVYGG
jgi:hypothetical protein